MTDSAMLRTEILRLVSQYYREKFANKTFEPFRDLVHFAGRVFDEEELTYLIDASLDFYLTANRYAERFEAELAEYLDLSNTMLVNSGSSANLVAMTALTSPKLGDRRLKPGDEVLTVAAGFPTTVAPIVQSQLVPVFVDVNLGDYTAIPERLAGAVSSRTRAIMMAHTMGVPFNLDVVLDLAKTHNLWLIEDNCDALGSQYRERLTGTFGHLSTFSFYPAHHITMGEARAVFTRSGKLAWVMASFRDWGRDCYCDPAETTPAASVSPGIWAICRPATITNTPIPISGSISRSPTCRPPVVWPNWIGSIHSSPRGAGTSSTSGSGLRDSKTG